MRKAIVSALAIGFIGLGTSIRLHAELLSKALLSFPASTKSIEYDNLAQLRKLPNYAALRQEYSGASLERVGGTLSKLGITENRIHEIVSTIGSSDFYGIVSGTFSGVQSGKRATELGFHRLLIGDQRIFCSTNGVCVMFLEDSLAAFGSATDLKAMLQAREGTAPRLGGRTPVSELLAKADLHAPVIGVAPGSELATVIGDSVPTALLSQASLSRLLGTISLFQYSVKLDDKAHLDLNLVCANSIQASALSQAVSALNALRSVASIDSTSTFEHMNASSNEKIVHLTVDVSIR